MKYLKIAENFGKKIWPYKDKLKIIDILLFGSTISREKNPADLDLLILHYSEKLENFQKIAESKIDDLEKLSKLAEILNKEINLINLLQGTSIERLISQNKFNVKYMDIKFFTDGEYQNNWKEKNSDPEFFKNIFSKGLLYNQDTQKYDLQASQKYNLEINLQRQNQLLF